MEDAGKRRTIVITGASDGIGAAAARRLVQDGHDVVVVGRSPEKTAAVAGPLGARHFSADFTRLAEVRELGARLRAALPRIDVLVNNAGGIFDRPGPTPDGHESTLQVNHLAPFLLTQLLLEPLIAARGTVVNTSSVAARIGRLRAEDLDGLGAAGGRGWSPHRAYADSKLANVLFTRGLARRYGPRGLASAAFHPGPVATNFASATTTALGLLYRTGPGRRLLISPERGAETLVWLAGTTPGRDWQSGGYYEKRRPARTNRRAGDDALVDGLWARSAELVGLNGPGR